jgi:hypothetical protein
MTAKVGSAAKDAEILVRRLGHRVAAPDAPSLAAEQNNLDVSL